MIKLTGNARTDAGLKRENNQDSFLLDNDRGLFVVADGMGGAASGEVASRLVVDSIRDYINSYIDQPIELADRYDFYDGELSDRANTLIQSIHLANEVVFQASHREGPDKGMGSTLAALMADGENVLAANAGDSRIYRYRGGELERLTQDHRFSEDSAFAGMIDPEATIMTTMGATLTRAMGVRERLKLDVHRPALEVGDMFLICSDGLSDMVKEDMISKVLGLERSLEQKTSDLVELALAAGGRDNVTVILVEAAASGMLKGLFNKLTKNN